MLHETVLPSTAEWMAEFSGWCFVRASQGIGYAMRGRIVEELEQGCLVVTPEAQSLTFRASQLGELRLHWFRLCPASLAGFFTLYEEHYLESVALKTNFHPRRFPADHPSAFEFAALVEERSSRSLLEARRRMLAVVIRTLEKEMAKYQFQQEDHTDAGVRFRQMISSMPASEIQNQSVRELAGRCGCSERHFSRLFREHFGFSIREQQMELKLRKAQQLLRESDARIVTVAMESGFRHLGLFHAMFKKRFGMTPTEWRLHGGSNAGSRRLLRLR